MCCCYLGLLLLLPRVCHMEYNSPNIGDMFMTVFLDLGSSLQSVVCQTLMLVIALVLEDQSLTCKTDVNQ